MSKDSRSFFRYIFDLYSKKPYIIGILLIIYLISFVIVYLYREERKVENELIATKARLAEITESYQSVRETIIMLNKPREWDPKVYSISNLDSDAQKLYSTLLDFTRYSITTGDYSIANKRLSEAKKIVHTPEIEYLNGFVAWGKNEMELAKKSWVEVATNERLPNNIRLEAVGLLIQMELSRGNYQDAKYLFIEFNKLFDQKNNIKSDYDKAIADYTKAIQLNPNYAEAYKNRGAAWYEIGDYDKAIADYTKAIQLNPNYAEAYKNRSAAWAKKGDHDRANIDYNKAIELNPKLR